MKLSFGAILSESFGFFFARLGLFFHLVTIPWILSLALRILTSAVTEQTLLTVLAEKAIDVIPTVMFQVAWMRLVLLGPERVERLPGLGWSRRETAFLLHLLKVAGVTFALIVAFTLTVGTIDPTMLGDAAANPDLVRREAMAAPLGTGFIVSALLALRVSFGLAATDGRPALVAAPLLGLWPRQQLDDHRQPVRGPVHRRRRDQHRRHRAARPAAQPRRRHRRRHRHLDDRDPRLLRQRRRWSRRRRR